jgi:hypothetical protein
MDENGAAVTRPFDDAALSLEEKKEHRSRRRSSATSGGDGQVRVDSADLPAEDDRSASGENGEVDRQTGLF